MGGARVRQRRGAGPLDRRRAPDPPRSDAHVNQINNEVGTRYHVRVMLV